MAKRKGTEKRQRIHRHTIRCNDAEQKILLAKKDQAGISIASLFRVAALDMPLPRATRRPTINQKLGVQLLGQFGKIGSNLNQAMKHMNAGHPQWNIVAEAARAILELRDAGMQALGREPQRKPNGGNAP
jgi:hypothetical protein